MGLTFMNANALFFLLVLILLYYFYRTANKEKKKQAMKFSSLHTIKAAQRDKLFWRKHILFILTCLTIFCLIVALADPHYPLKRKQKGVNVVLVLDVSRSMEAKDFTPNRLEAAKVNAKLLVDQLEPNDMIGVIIFGAGTSTTSFLTTYKDKVNDKLDTIKLGDAAADFFSGCHGLGCKTYIGDGLALGVDMVTSVENKKKVIILLSDGANNGGAFSPDEAIEFAKINNIQVFTIGMGREKIDQYGRVTLDEETLIKIAQETNAEYYNAIDDNTLKQIYGQLSEKIKREKQDEPIKDWFIVAAILFLLAALYVRIGRKRIIQ